MTVTGDEVMFFKVHGDDLNVICTGCKSYPASHSMPTLTTTSTPSSSSSSNTYSNLSESTSTESTTANCELCSCCEQTLNEANSISKVEHEEKLNETYAMFGGILAGVIIINIVAIGIYCFIRKRNKAGKSPDVPEYGNAEFRLPNESESPQYQGLNL